MSTIISLIIHNTLTLKNLRDFGIKLEWLGWSFLKQKKNKQDYKVK